jgi:hypothetical protein
MMGLMAILLIVGYHLVESTEQKMGEIQINILPLLFEIPFIIDLFLGFIRLP